MVVIDLDVGAAGASCERVCFVPFCPHSHLETDKKNILDQYTFREDIVKSWMDGDNEAALTEDARKRKRSEVAPQAHSISLRSRAVKVPSLRATLVAQPRRP